MSTPDERLSALGLELPEAPAAVGSYLQAKRDGDHLYLSGHGPLDPQTGDFVTGKVGGDGDVSVEQGYEAARMTGLLLLATAKAELGTLDDIASVVRLFGMVNCAPGFTNTPAIINGCSELLLAVLGEEVGSHTRSAVGMAELPFGIAVEVEAVLRVR